MRHKEWYRVHQWTKYTEDHPLFSNIVCPLKRHSFINGPRSLNIGKLLNRDWENEGCHFCWKHTEACIQLAFPFRKHLKLLFDQKASEHIQGDRREVSRPLRRSSLDDNYRPLNSWPLLRIPVLWILFCVEKIQDSKCGSRRDTVPRREEKEMGWWQLL